MTLIFRKKPPLLLLQFLRGECFTCRGNRCTPLGFHADPSLASSLQMKKYYTMTTAKSPFCSKVEFQELHTILDFSFQFHKQLFFSSIAASPHKVQFTLKTQQADSNSKAKRGYVYVTLYGSLATSGKVLLTPR